jgi:hypothetical protein
MKKLFQSIIVYACFLSGTYAQDKAKQTDMAYKATYSSEFKIGNPSYSKMILEVWKDWDDNKLDRHDYFADSLVMMFPDGSVSKGKKASMESAMKYRATITTAKSTVHAIVPLRSTDRNEDVVCVWGTEDDTMTDGKTEKRDLHEVWWFNKDGKIVFMRQFAAKFGEMK